MYLGAKSFICITGFGLTKVWVGIVQRDVNALGKRREYKWYWSGVPIPSERDYWKNRYLPNSNDCMLMFAVICEW